MSDEVSSMEHLQLIAAKPLRILLGGIADMTLHRWLETGKFPQPIVAGNKGHRFWRMTDVAEWQATNLRTAVSDNQERLGSGAT